MKADFKRAARFHGHVCPGLAIGYRAAKAALRRLGVKRAQDEELVAIVENDSCSVDAVQALTGCTFGKGNFIYRDYGKQVFTFLRRPTGTGVRVALRAAATRPSTGNAKFDALSEKVSKGKATKAERLRQRKLRTELILTMPEDELFGIRRVRTKLPGAAQIRKSIICDRCGEPTMETRIVRVRGRSLCIPCSLTPRRRRGRV
jgi:formylmethanofuran dehydrogenase subunit E